MTKFRGGLNFQLTFSFTVTTMDTRRFYKNFLLNNSTIPELSQTYHHVYFKDIKGEYLAANALMLNYFERSSGHITLFSDKDILTDPNTYRRVAENDEHTLRDNTIKIFNEYGVTNNKKASFLSIKAPLHGENEAIGVLGISISSDRQNYSEFYQLLKIINSLFQVDIEKKAIANDVLTANPSRPILTQRELDCLSLYMAGKSAKEIASLLFLSRRTIEYHLQNIKTKLCVNKRSELLHIAFSQFSDLSCVN